VQAPGPLPTEPRAAGVDVGSHILVGIDDTPESLVAAAQAGALRSPEGRLVLVAVAERYLAAHAGLAAAKAEEHVAAHTSDDLARARELVHADESIFCSGRLVPVLAAESERRGATLIAVGVRPHRLLPARVLRGHEVEALQQAVCSVLIARPGWGPHRPDRVVVGVDGPAESVAEATGRLLAARLGCELVPVVGLEDVDEPAVFREGRKEAVLVPGQLASAVADVATAGSLVVVCGRAGRFLDHVVFGVRCSVLVVRHDSPAGA
jgi:nucleotide-binding universal stress UspA family protein